MAATTETGPVSINPQPEAPTPLVVAEEPEDVKTAEAAAPEPAANEAASLENASFKEESNFVSDLKESEKKALQELKIRVEEAIKNNEFVEPPPKPEEPPKTEEEKEAAPPKTEEAPKAEEAPEMPKIEEEPPKTEAAEVKEEEKEEVKTTIAETAVKAEVAPSPAPAPADTEEKITLVSKETQTEDYVVEEEVAPVTAQVVAEASEVEEKAEEVKEAEAAAAAPPEEVYLWGVPLNPSKGDERTDVVLLKFLRARDFKVADAFTMIKNTVLWRKKFRADSIMEEDFGNELDGVAYMHGVDKEGHPVCYNVYGLFQDKDLYQKTFGDEAKRDRFLRWRVQVLEKGFQQLSFSPGGISSMVQITDLKNAPGLVKWEHRQATNKAVALLQDNYPEFVAKKIFINVPWWFLALNTMISPFITQRTKSKFVVARSARVPETLFKYIAPEYVPVQYGGLSRENDTEFSAAEGGVAEQIVKAGGKHIVEIPVSEEGTTLVWDLSVVGWEVSYGAEFVPSAESSYTVIIQKARKYSPTEEPIRQSYKIGESGKIVLTIDNTSSKRKKILYRSKVKAA